MGTDQLTPMGSGALNRDAEAASKLMFWALVVYLVVDRIVPDQYVVPLGISIKLPQVVLMGVGLLLLLAMVMDGRPLVRGLVGLFGLLTVVFLLIAPWINALGLSQVEADGAERGIVTTILLAILFVAAYYVAVPDGHYAQRLILIVLGLTVVQAGIALFESFSGIYVTQSWGFLNLGFLEIDPGLERLFGFEGAFRGQRPTSTAPHPIVLSSLLALGILLILAKLPTTERRRNRILLLLLVLPLLAALFVLETRTGLVVLAVCGAIGVLLVVRRHTDLVIRFSLLGMGALAAVVVMFPANARSMLNLFARVGQDDSISGRTSDYELIPNLLEARPMVGPGFMTRDPSGLFLDNSYLDGLLEFGVVGLVIVLAFFTAALTRLVRAATRATSTTDLVVITTGSLAMLSLLVAMALFDALKFEQFLPTVVLLMALGLARADAISREPEPGGGAKRRPQTTAEARPRDEARTAHGG